MTVEDLQERYRDRRAEIKPNAVPLAADAAHLLTDYLDQLCIEFVRAGLKASYRITREYEEIFVQELQQESSTAKLSYEVTKTMLEKYGTPAELVKSYIAENNPTQKTKSVDLSDQDTPSLLWESVIGVVLIGLIGIQLLHLINLPVFMADTNSLTGLYLLFTVVFISIELVQGLFGYTGLRKQYYHTLREVIRFLSTAILLATTIGVLDLFSLHYGLPNYRFRNFWWNMFILWAAIYGIGLLKDHTDLLMTTAPHEKPIARIFLPSYITLIGAYIAGFVSAIIQIDNYRIYHNSENLMFLALLLALISLVLEIRRRYPLSIKKIGYTIILGLYLPLITYSYYEFGEFFWDYSIEYFWDNIISITIIWLLLASTSIIIIFRHEIGEQLDRYKLQLEEYKS